MARIGSFIAHLTVRTLVDVTLAIATLMSKQADIGNVKHMSYIK